MLYKMEGSRKGLLIEPIGMEVLSSSFGESCVHELRSQLLSYVGDIVVFLLPPIMDRTAIWSRQQQIRPQETAAEYTAVLPDRYSLFVGWLLAHGRPSKPHSSKAVRDPGKSNAWKEGAREKSRSSFGQQQCNMVERS